MRHGGPRRHEHPGGTADNDVTFPDSNYFNALLKRDDRILTALSRGPNLTNKNPFAADRRTCDFGWRRSNVRPQYNLLMSLPLPSNLEDGLVQLRQWELTDIECVRLAATDPDIPKGTTVPPFSPRMKVAHSYGASGADTTTILCSASSRHVTPYCVILCHSRVKPKELCLAADLCLT